MTRRRVVAWGLLALAVAGAVAIRATVPWVPLWYLAAVVGGPVLAWKLLRWRAGPVALRWPVLAVVAATVVGLCPVPWMEASLANPPGTAWRLDGRLVIDGEVADPPGAWWWLTVGRPPVVAEVVADRLTGGQPRAVSLTNGRRAQRPAFNEPAAVSVGLRRAGRAVDLGVLVEGRDPDRAGVPSPAVLVELNGIELASRADWDRAVEALGAGERRGANVLVTADGTRVAFEGSALPYRSVDVLDVPADGLDAAIGGWFSRLPPVERFRGLALGRSHGLMLALVAYAHHSGEDLAGGRSIAGTGGIRGDEVVTRIGGLRAKATAARRAGADVLLFPAEQAHDLDGFDPGRMRLVPVTTLDDAIDALRAPR